MRSRIPLNKDQQKVVRQTVREEFQKQGHEMARRYFKLFCVALNRDYGFGRERLKKVIGEIEKTSSQSFDDPIFWTHIDKVCIDELKMPFEREDYAERGE